MYLIKLFLNPQHEVIAVVSVNANGTSTLTTAKLYIKAKHIRLSAHQESHGHKESSDMTMLGPLEEPLVLRLLTVSTCLFLL